MLTSRFRTVIAEDDDETRSFLESLLSKMDNVALVAVVSSGIKLIKAVKETNPDLIFVDIEMPEMDGLKSVNMILDEGFSPYVVFLTGHAEFALDAFDLNAIDYITKPVRMPRLQKVFDKIKTFQEKEEKHLSEIKNILASRERIFIKTGLDLTFIDTDSIIMVEHQVNKSVIFCKESKHTTSESLNSLEKKLNFPEFFRTHKSYIVNLKHISQIKPLGNRSYEILFQNVPLKALISRSKVQNIFSLLNIND